MVIITEDIIRKALNESIDEFMLQENGVWNSIANTANRWNNTAKNYASKWGLDKAWNGIKNFAAAYMDKKTNGQWNKKYNIYTNGNSKFAMLSYLEKWLKKNHGYLANLSEYGQKNDPIDYYRKNLRKNIHKGDPRYDPEAYIMQICTPKNFFTWARQYNKGQMKSDSIISEYITTNIQNNGRPSISKALKYLNINEFYADPIGKKYLNYSRKERAYSAKQQRAQQPQPQPQPQQQKPVGGKKDTNWKPSNDVVQLVNWNK